MLALEAIKIWDDIIREALILSEKEPILSNFYKINILQHNSLSDSLSYILASKLATSVVSEKKIEKIFNKIYLQNSILLHYIVKDIQAILYRDPVVKNYLIPLLYFKGFHALESYRLSHHLWTVKKNTLSMFLQNRMSTVFAVDIHPAANIGSGVMLDHATGIVIGEGVIIENDVSILHSVTLGGTGKNKSRYRHPTIRKGVIIGAGAKILGNIEIGSKTKVGAGSVVLKTVPSHVTVAGIPGKIVKKFYKKNMFSHNEMIKSISMTGFQHGDGI